MGGLCECVTESSSSSLSNSEWISMMALLFSIISFVISQIISMNRVKKEKEISNARYEEQKRQYEERLVEEKVRRREDELYMDKRNRISEEPRLVFKSSKIVSAPTLEQVVICTEFLNKGRGSAYDIVPDEECTIKTFTMKEFKLHRFGAVKDPIAMVGEVFVVNWSYFSEETLMFRMTPTIKYRDASGRMYKQTYCIDIVDRDGNANLIDYAQPELIEE